MTLVITGDNSLYSYAIDQYQLSSLEPFLKWTVYEK